MGDVLLRVSRPSGDWLQSPRRAVWRQIERKGVPGKPRRVKAGLKGQEDPGLFGSYWVLVGESLRPALSDGWARV